MRGDLIQAATTLIMMALAVVAVAHPSRSSQAIIEAQAEAHHRLPDGILSRHRAYERAEPSIYLRPWSDGRGAVCGQHQISVVDIATPDGARLCALARTPGGGAWEAARQMSESRRWCRRQPGRCACPWARLNFGDQARLCRALSGDET